MARPTSKTDLMQAAAVNWQKLNDFAAGLTEAELAAPFDFSADEKKKEAHWRRDKNLRDVLIHLWEWHQLLLKWVQANQAGEERPFLPAPYNWKTYGQMNQEFGSGTRAPVWRRHRRCWRSPTRRCWPWLRSSPMSSCSARACLSGLVTTRWAPILSASPPAITIGL